jgi:hypothetical protein
MRSPIGANTVSIPPESPPITVGMNLVFIRPTRGDVDDTGIAADHTMQLPGAAYRIGPMTDRCSGSRHHDSRNANNTKSGSSPREQRGASRRATTNKPSARRWPSRSLPGAGDGPRGCASDTFVGSRRCQVRLWEAWSKQDCRRCRSWQRAAVTRQIRVSGRHGTALAKRQAVGGQPVSTHSDLRDRDAVGGVRVLQARRSTR